MNHQLLVTGIVTVLVGALSGGITNAVAVWMLFHPHDRRGFGPFRFHGAIPKNKARLAKSVGKAVGERLLTPEDLAQRLSTPSVYETFARAIGGFLNDLLERDRGPLRQGLSPSLLETVEQALPELSDVVARRLAEYTAGPAFVARVEVWQEKLRAELGDRPLGEVLTAGRRESLARKVDEWVGQMAEGEALENAVRGFITQQMDSLARDDRPLLERLPPGLVGAVEQGITDYLPVAVERLGSVLQNPDTRRQVEGALRDAFDHTVRDLLLHERILAKMVVTDRTIARLVDGFERRGLDRLGFELKSPAIEAQVARAVNDAVVSFLRIPLAERFRRLGEQRRADLEKTLGDWAVKLARDAGTRRVIGQTVDRALHAAEQRTWGDVLDAIPAETLARLIADAAAGPRGKQWVEETVRSVANHLLDRPLGRPAGWLGEERSARVRQDLVEAAWGWVQSQIPMLVGQIQVQEMVEQKVLGFSTQRMEEIVRNVTQKELDLIVNLGYVLGAIVGAIAFGINVMLGR